MIWYVPTAADAADARTAVREWGIPSSLTPYDMDQLYRGTGLKPEELLLRAADLSVVDGIILPHLKMTGKRDCCPFLSGEGRCRIHAFRPGFCRLFPLGRLYEDGSFSYFLQTKECKKNHRSKIRIKKWLDIPDLPRYEDYVCSWHYLLMDLQTHIERAGDESYQKQVSMYVLQNFYLTPYPEEGFYEAFQERYETCKNALSPGIRPAYAFRSFTVLWNPERS